MLYYLFNYLDKNLTCWVRGVPIYFIPRGNGLDHLPDSFRCCSVNVSLNFSAANR
jgi:hypothetical protein